jgi:hypothetical protein
VKLLESPAVTVEFQFLFLLLAHLCAGAVLGKMLRRKRSLLFIGVSSALLTVVPNFMWMREFPLSLLAAYFFVTFLCASLVSLPKLPAKEKDTV